MSRRYMVVDVFTADVTRGNPVAVVLDAGGLDARAMQHIARWTNLSETTFVLPPGDSSADYRVRIFTPGSELPFAGHPTLGTAHAVVSAGRAPSRGSPLVQECGAGLITVEYDARNGVTDCRLRLPAARFADVRGDVIGELQAAIGAPIDGSVGPACVNVGPTWLVARLESAAALLGLQPDMGRLASLERRLGVTGTTLFAASAEGRDVDIEVRSFVPSQGIAEDPVCGSGNGSVAAFRRERGLLAAGHAEYVARQGRCVGRDGIVRVTLEPSGEIWIGGACVTAVEGVLHA